MKELIETLEKALALVKSSDPHAKNKVLYAKDAAAHVKPWELWEVHPKYGTRWVDCRHPPLWAHDYIYRRKQTKKLVDWIPLCKWVNTNYGELLKVSTSNKTALLSGASNAFMPFSEIRFLPPLDDDGWMPFVPYKTDLKQAYQAGFICECKNLTLKEDGSVSVIKHRTGELVSGVVIAYRVIAIRDGFTDNPEEVV